MKIVVIESLGVSQELRNQFVNSFESAGHQCEFYADRNENPQEIIKRAKDAEVLVVSNIVINEEILKELKSLKFIAVAFTGVDHIDLDYCKKHNIQVCNAAGYSTRAVAETALGLMIAVSRKIVEMHQNTLELGSRAGFAGAELYGKTVGLIGSGAIGLHLAKILIAMGCKVIAHSRSERAEAVSMGIVYVDKDTLLKQSDIISIHTPLNESTKLMLGKEEFEMMKNTALVINTARGYCINNKELAIALEQGIIGGAGIDVYEMEPPLPANYPLLKSPNCVLLPHIAYASQEALDARLVIVKDNLIAWFKGVPTNLV